MMNNIRIILPLIILYSGLFAVINTYEASYSKINNIDTPFESLSMSEIDVEALLRQDEENAGIGVPIRFSHPFNVDFGINNSGTWEEIGNGTKIWRLGLHSPGAHGMKVLFDKFNLPEGAEIYIFSKDEDMSIGPYTHEQNNVNGTFGIPLVKSDHIVVEYYQPEDVSQIPQLNINTVFHAYRDIHGFYGGRDDRDCGDNVACSNAAVWEDQVNSVIYLEMGSYICSAALVNNTSQDLTPYVLTAYHCVEGEAGLGQHNWFTFYFNHQSSSCSGSSGNYGQSETGSYIRSWGNTNTSDFALLEMDDAPASWWDPYFAGWRRNTSAPTIGSGIHHPGGAAKKINFDNDVASSCSWYNSSTHWCLSWDQGGTAGGSSGSPVFDNNKRIIGQLTGGTGADCGGGTDYYGKFSKSWSNSNSSSGNLKAWLDPSNTNVYTLDGTYDGETIINGCTDSSACNYDSDATNNDGSCEYVQGSCNCNGDPSGNYCDCNYNVDDECGVCDGDGSSCAGSVTLGFNSIDGNAGTAEIYMENDVAIAGFQFIIIDSPNYLDLINVSGGSAVNYDFTLSSSESGTIVGFSLTGSYIPAGSDNLLIATFDNNNDDQIFDLCLEEAIFSDINASAVPTTIDACEEMYFSSSLTGDLNDDGLVNVLDVVILVNIVLTQVDAPDNADLNIDGLVNILDVVILINIILEG